MIKGLLCSNFFRIFVYLVAIIAYHWVDANEIIYTVEDANLCLEGNGVTCQTRKNASESVCCNNLYAAENCTSVPTSDENNWINYEFCSTDVYKHTELLAFTFPFDTKHCSQQPCLTGVIQNSTSVVIDYDCAYTNPTILQTCLGICKSADCIDACTEE